LAPFGDFGMVAADEDFGNFPAAKIGGASVMGKVEHGAAVGEGLVESAGGRFFRALEKAEGFVLGKGVVAEGAWQEPCDRVKDESCGKFAAGKNEIADGDFFGGEVLGDAFVHAFIAAAEEENAIELREAACSFLREAFACGGEQDYRRARISGMFCRG